MRARSASSLASDPADGPATLALSPTGRAYSTSLDDPLLRSAPSLACGRLSFLLRGWVLQAALFRVIQVGGEHKEAFVLGDDRAERNDELLAHQGAAVAFGSEHGSGDADLEAALLCWRL